jgi:hypothetical protein
MRYNPPPNWPPAPEGWQPPAGWQPDPSWGPAPQGWQLWLNDNGTPMAPVYGSSGPAPYSELPPKKKKHRFRNFVVGVATLIIVIVVIAVAAGSSSKNNTTTADTSNPVTATTTADTSNPVDATTAAAPTTTKAKSGGGTVSQAQALLAAKGYLDMGSGFSRKSLIEQLSSKAGNGFPVADATWAADHSGADWNAQAVLAAKGYISMGGFSHASLIEQLSSPAGNQFTLAQATYAAAKVGL